ncbi:MAG: PQQ-binding-like beta-propeller repeat protein [Phycisphaerales bacterium]|nr:PQQ-binding-like beta-propeller repeat protein [Phycisphaerales bacterium]MCB9863675.1 PQQ-binding-like beta-propeller repeat protein [Phycisphaerales bacterium]
MKIPTRVAAATILCLFVFPAAPTFGQSLVKPEDAERLGMQMFWQASAPVPTGEFAASTKLVDDNIYLMTPSNVVVAVHAGTGVVRWVTQVADPGQTVRGPTHSDNYAFFTAPGAVKAIDRRTGLPAEQPRKLRGVVITVEHDTAEISLGRAHGVRLDDVLDIVDSNESNSISPEPIARLKITVIGERISKGRILQETRTSRVRSGDRVWADIGVPIQAIKLPFAPSSPAVANDEDIFVGAANQRMYSLRFLTGFQNWQVSTPKNMSAAPALFGDSVYFCDQDGRCAAATQRRRDKVFEFYTDGAIFVSPVVTQDHVFVASSDRSLYCLQRVSPDNSPRRAGDRIWQQRFDEAPVVAPIVSGDLVFQRTSSGLYAVNIEDGEVKWNRPGSSGFLARMDDEAYLWESATRRIVRVKVEDGKEVAAIDVPSADYALANVENQLVILGTQMGRLTCLRPKDAPYLKPAQLALVLQNDKKARELNTLLADSKAEREAAAKAKAEAARGPERPAYSFLDDDDWLVSTSDRVPVGTRNLVTEKGDVKPKAEDKAEAKKEEAKPAKEDSDDDDVWGDDNGDDADKKKADSDDDKDDDKKDADNDNSSDDDSDKDGDDDDDGDDDW